MAAMLYRVVTQAVILFVSETWFLSVSMERMVDGTQTGSMIQITGKQVRRKADGARVIPKAEVVREAVGNQSAVIYTRIRQGAVAQWVAMRPIFQVCAS